MIKTVHMAFNLYFSSSCLSVHNARIPGGAGCTAHWVTSLPCEMHILNSNSRTAAAQGKRGFPLQSPRCKAVSHRRNEIHRRSSAAAAEDLPTNSSPLVRDVVPDPSLKSGPDGPSQVDLALLKVQQAMQVAEVSMSNVHNLPSARLPTMANKLWAAVKPFVLVVAVLAVSAAAHSLNPLGQLVGGFFMASLVGLWGYRRSSLNASGVLGGAGRGGGGGGGYPP
jgi:hypothetical protein